MATMHNSLWSPYGAYELKASYQRNLLTGTAITAGFIGLILLTFWVMGAMKEEDFAMAPGVVIKTIADLGPPPSIAKKPPQVKVDQPNVAAPKVGIPKPVADDEVLDEDVVLATREELAEIIAPDVTIGDGGDVMVDIDESEFLPSPEDFVAVEILPEMIHQYSGEYPRLAKQAGITGLVWVKALVDKEGNVRQAILGKSSGTQSLDEAAVEWAYKYKYKPAIQNGRPLAVWVTYKVDFVLDD